MTRTTWKDLAGREWLCHIRIEEAQRLKSEGGLDLLNEKCLKDLTEDPFQVIYLLTCLHREQFEKDGLTVGDFAERCTATESVANAAAHALGAAIADLLRRLRRPALAEVVETANELSDKAQEQQLELVRTEGRRVMADAVERDMEDLRKTLSTAGATLKGGKPGTAPAP